MNWLLRPSILILVSIGLALSAATLVLWPRQPATGAIPHAVPVGDQEIVWLYAATNASPWERLVTAAGKAKERLQATYPDLTLEIDDHNAFPQQTTSLPEFSIGVKGQKPRLWVRWYKLTSDLKMNDWVAALAARQPPPLAIIGGGSSDLAISLARHLRTEADNRSLGTAAPLLLLTTATADAVAGENGSGEIPLSSFYPGRTFRFCFTNRQMADAVSDFIWSQDDLRPDCDPFYVTFWEDDPYSKDLNQRFCEVLRQPPVITGLQDLGWLAGTAATGSIPLDLGSLWWGQYRSSLPESARIPYSVGTFADPNRWEEEEAVRLMETKALKYAFQRRPLLVVPAASQPTRRFLRALARIAPLEARRFVVATGDAIPFNTVYRDRNMAWPIRDLPFAFVFFCHRNPVDRALGFQEQEGPRSKEADAGSPSSTGTEDLLLFMDILETVAQSCFLDDSGMAVAALPVGGSELKQRLKRARWGKETNQVAFTDDGPALFDSEGNRRSGTGEHIVYLQPMFRGETILPEAALTVWSWQIDSATGKHHWHREELLMVQYKGYSDER